MKYTYTPRYYDYSDNNVSDGRAYSSLENAKRALKRKGFIKCVGKDSTFYNTDTKVEAVIYADGI